ncbi:MAG: vgr related protein [Sphingomonas sp.]|uniref:vgr related protein n=1 Tax=Sphingomonas sp. TaxID=28214 RepID=UPI00356B1148
MLSTGEIALARGVFGDAIDYARVRIVRRKWMFFQPRDTVMAPLGKIHFHPAGTRYRDDFAVASLADQALFIHEMVHVWQHQRGLFLPLLRHPWCRYDYVLKPGQPLHRYGIEQQAEIVADVFLLRQGARMEGAAELAAYAGVLPFGNA